MTPEEFVQSLADKLADLGVHSRSSDGYDCCVGTAIRNPDNRNAAVVLDRLIAGDLSRADKAITEMAAYIAACGDNVVFAPLGILRATENCRNICDKGKTIVLRYTRAYDPVLGQWVNRLDGLFAVLKPEMAYA